MTSVDFRNIESLLLQLLMLLSTVFSGSEKNEVQEFIDVGEYGLALDTLVDIIVEENKQIQEDALLLALEVATAMALDGEAVKVKLARHVKIS